MLRFMDDFIKQMDEAMGQLCNFDRMLDTKRRDYGCGIEMSTREIHVLEIIYNHPHLNTTELAELAGLQKGTFSKMVRRFEQWGLLERYQTPENRKEVFFRATPLGQKAYDGHYRFHEQTSATTYEYFQHYSAQQQANILEFISHYTQYLRDYF